jgi:hypothetical protein
MKETQQLIVWRCVNRAKEMVTASEVADKLGLRVQTASNALHDLRRRGCIEAVGKNRGCKYFTTAGSQPPTDRRGTHPNSRRCLQKWDWKVGMAAIRGYKLQREDHILDQCWTLYEKAKVSAYSGDAGGPNTPVANAEAA